MAYEKVKPNQDGWSDWILPIMDGYNMACCDCCMVHRLQFKVTIVRGKRRVEFRAKRNNRATGQLRRYRKGIFNDKR